MSKDIYLCMFLLLYLFMLLPCCFSHVWLLCDPLDGSPPGSSIPRILQARTLEWVAISFSNAWKWKVQVKSLHRVRLFVIPWTVAQWLLHPWDIPGKSTGMGCHCLLWSSKLEKRKTLIWKRHMHPNVHIIYNFQDLEATQIPINRWLT